MLARLQLPVATFPFAPLNIIYFLHAIFSFLCCCHTPTAMSSSFFELFAIILSDIASSHRQSNNSTISDVCMYPVGTSDHLEIIQE